MSGGLRRLTPASVRVKAGQRRMWENIHHVTLTVGQGHALVVLHLGGGGTIDLSVLIDDESVLVVERPS